MDLATAPRGVLVRTIFDQQDRIASLEAQIAELRSQITKQGPTKEESLPSWVKPNMKSKRKQERQKRVENFSRKSDIPTHHVVHTYDDCPDCGGRLGKPAVSYTRQVIDIPPTTAEVTGHVIMKRWCFSCQKRVAPKVNLAGVVMGKQRVGIRLMSIIDMLKEACRQPLETIQSYLEMLYHLHLSQGEIVTILQRTAAKGKPTYESMLKQLRKADIIWADETGGRENGVNGYHWSFNTTDTQVLVYDKSRSNDMVEKVLGKTGEEGSFTGVLSTDFYTGYNIYEGFHQRCWVHLLRDIKKLKEQYKNHPPLNRWAKEIKTIYQQAKAYGGPDPTLPLRKREEEREDKQAYFEEKLRRIAKPWTQKDVPMSILSARIMKHLQELFVFVRFEAVPSDNNTAERMVRHMVVKRKISGGTRSHRGSETNSILSSLFGTWKLQNKNPLTQFQLLLASCQ